ncbi:hypothetical protein MMJ50_12345 [Enterococcus cecorum]|uniref:hypothetical protein n=1 Tax=Enterococcus cecorum TaxID=44008 RepID=UPI00174CA3B3|nr:hypothetical protein [Enterococcus cecorum]MCJ0593443.1 hypothetical protein [Enterococcus cecorum]
MIKDYIKSLKNTNEKKRRLNSKYTFINNSKKSKDLCIILSGYSNYLWEAVFGRIYKYAPKDLDICIVSSGIYSEELMKIAQKNGWSYVSTKRNQLCIAQNIAISLFPEAENVYKLDEDMFVTKEFFSDMKKVYEHAMTKSRYDVGFVSPLTPINAYGYIRLLEKIGKIDIYDKTIEKAIYGGSEDKGSSFLKNKEVPNFLNSIEELSDIDELSAFLNSQPMEYYPCPVRYNIGAIYFKRKVWEDMGMFSVPIGGCGLGVDESDLCAYCICNSKTMMISENSAVAHFCYGAQKSDKLIEEYKKNEEKYLVKNEI